MNHKGKMTFKSRINSFGYAINGIKAMFRTEHNAILHAIAAVGVTITGFVFDITSNEWIVQTLAIVTVFSAEMLNTSIERLTDYVSPLTHPLVGEIKDIAAGAVLIPAIGSVIIGAIIYTPKIIELCTL